MDSVDEALAAVDDGDLDRRREAARTLFVRARGEPEAVAGDVDALRTALDDEDPTVRGHALAALSWLGDAMGSVDPPREALVDALTDPDDGVRQTAVGLLSDPGRSFPERLRPRVAAGLVGCLVDDNDLVRLRAAETISASAVDASADSSTAVAALLDALEDDRPDVRTNAGETVATLAVDHPGRLSGHESRLESLTDSEYDDVRASAGFALAVLREDPETVRAAVTALCDTLPVDRRWAATHWMKLLLDELAGQTPGAVADAIEDHDDPPADLARLARRIRNAGS